MNWQQVHRHYLQLKQQVQADLQLLHRQRTEQLAPNPLYIPELWQPVTFDQPVRMYKVMAAKDGSFMSVYDKQVAYRPGYWTYARHSCKAAWPPLWSCMCAYPTEQQARSAVFPKGSHHKKGARVLVAVQVAGKAYKHQDGRVAASAVLFDAVLDYVPKGPAHRVVQSLNYNCAAIDRE
eukprot:GHRR01004952.1.p1 GENE.GHRR01004952.1~~GHRR01004952.1.p1  ORF type:complete len:179 (+),score=57.98 GHRR01004952.1:172-708(+)